MLKEQLKAEPLTLGEFGGIQGGAAIGQRLESWAQSKGGRTPLAKDVGLLALNVILSVGTKKLTGKARTAAGYGSALAAGALAPAGGQHIQKAIV